MLRGRIPCTEVPHESIVFVCRSLESDLRRCLWWQRTPRECAAPTGAPAPIGSDDDGKYRNAASFVAVDDDLAVAVLTIHDVARDVAVPRRCRRRRSGEQFVGPWRLAL